MPSISKIKHNPKYNKQVHKNMCWRIHLEATGLARSLSPLLIKLAKTHALIIVLYLCFREYISFELHYGKLQLCYMHIILNYWADQTPWKGSLLLEYVLSHSLFSLTAKFYKILFHLLEELHWKGHRKGNEPMRAVYLRTTIKDICVYYLHSLTDICRLSLVFYCSAYF